MSDLIEHEILDRRHHSQVIALLHNFFRPYLPKDEDLNQIWDEYFEQPTLRAIVLTKHNRVVGFGSLLIETKIRGGKMGHIEDIVIEQSVQGKGYGRKLIDILTKTAEMENCYKISLQCKENNIEFYEKCDFIQSGTAMQKFINK